MSITGAAVAAEGAACAADAGLKDWALAERRGTLPPWLLARLLGVGFLCCKSEVLDIGVGSGPEVGTRNIA